MGLYSFVCDECSYKQDMFTPLKDRDTVRKCPGCGKDTLKYAFDASESNVSVNFDKDYTAFSTKSRTVLILKMLQDKSSLEVDRYADELLPSIDIIAGYSIEGDGRDMNNEEHMAYVGVSMDWPLPGVVEKARYETSKIDKTFIVMPDSISLPRT